MKNAALVLFALAIILTGCLNKGTGNRNNSSEMEKDSTLQYGFNRDFLKEYTDIIELRSGNSALAIVPAWQGRVMTSTSEGDKGFSFGWINRGLIASRETKQHINAFGGEERLWMGPEGGQFSIFFRKGTDFVYENWQTPDFIDTKPYEITALSGTSVSFKTSVSVENYSGTRFEFDIERAVTILAGEKFTELSGISAEGINYVAYDSYNTISNKGKDTWNKDKGLLSVWMLGMYNPSPDVVVVIPVREGTESSAGMKVNDNYFGRISSDRLKVEGNHVFFRTDGKSRGKIGIPPLRVSGVMGSFDSQNNILTLLFCKLPGGVTDYVNSAWQIQDNPYSGDAFNSYNDGPLDDGSQMGPFYELETSSPAAALAPGQSMTHSQTTVHLTGDKEKLNTVALKILGCSLSEIANAFR